MNFKWYTTLLFLFFFGIVSAQNKYSTKTGTIDFEGSVVSFEEVKASNNNVSAILNTETGEFASLALIQGFRFKVALMEEHFNENYMESSDFPKAVFKGKIEGFSLSGISEIPSEEILKGTITIHGVTQSLEAPVRIKKVGEAIELQTEFILKPEQFDIIIPSIVRNKIAEEIIVKAIYSLKI
jgi:hypothetical protein